MVFLLLTICSSPCRNCEITYEMKKTAALLQFWWEGMDSNHRSETQQIYSLPPLATREPPQKMELVAGLEPVTC